VPGTNGTAGGFGDCLTSIDAIRELIPPPAAPAEQKAIDHLDAHCRAFIDRSPFFVLASADAAGRCDASPKGGPPGFARVLDEHRLAVPDYPGNRRLDSYTNILESPGVELIFLIPRVAETLRVRGSASLTRDPDVLARLDDAGRTPKLALGVTVERCFLQCGKALKRSELWQPDAWPALDGMPSAAQIFRDHIALEGMTVEATEQHLEHNYATELWPE
jgi:PPOX class probable FMN-dependent enzyme